MAGWFDSSNPETDVSLKLSFWDVLYNSFAPSLRDVGIGIPILTKSESDQIAAQNAAGNAAALGPAATPGQLADAGAAAANETLGFIDKYQGGYDTTGLTNLELPSLPDFGSLLNVDTGNAVTVILVVVLLVVAISITGKRRR